MNKLYLVDELTPEHDGLDVGLLTAAGVSVVEGKLKRTKHGHWRVNNPAKVSWVVYSDMLIRVSIDA